MTWLALFMTVLVISAFAEYFKKSAAKWMWHLSLVLFTTISGFRNMGGADYLIYRKHYQGKDESTFELGYEVLVKVFNLIGINYEGFVFIVSLFCSFVIARFIKRFSPKPNLSLFLYTGAFFIYYNLIATRQLIALSFFLVGLSYLFDRQELRSVLILLFGSLFHTSILVTIFGIVFIRFYKIGFLFFILIFTIFIQTGFDLVEIILIFSKYGLSFVESRMVYDYLLSTRVIPITTFVRIIFTCALIVNFIYRFGLEDYKLRASVILYLIFVFLFMIFNSYDIMMRIWVYFEILSIILIPHIISAARMKLIKFSLILFYICFYLFSFFNNIVSFDDGDFVKFNLVFFS
jgi:transmembrane protein EpsG